MWDVTGDGRFLKLAERHALLSLHLHVPLFIFMVLAMYKKPGATAVAGGEFLIFAQSRFTGKRDLHASEIISRARRKRRRTPSTRHVETAASILRRARANSRRCTEMHANSPRFFDSFSAFGTTPRSCNFTTSALLR